MDDNINILIGVPSPRDIPEVRESLDKLNADKFIVKYKDEPTAYREIQHFFLANKKWNYLCIHPDDLIVTEEGFDTLVGDLHQFIPRIISGVCNLTADQFDNDKYAVKLYEHESFLKIEEKRKKYRNTRYQIVYFSGFACILIRRDIVQKIPFRQHSPTFESGFDSSFAKDCKEYQIPIIVDWKADFQHLEYRLGHGKLENFNKGIKTPYNIFCHAGENLPNWS